MALVKARKPEDVLYSNPVTNRISQLRYCLLVHSLFYYELSLSYITDTEWDAWAKELVELQSNNAEASKKAIFYPQFLDFDGSTGHDLPYKDRQILETGARILRYKNNEKSLSLLRSISSEGYEFEQYKKNGYKYLGG